MLTKSVKTIFLKSPYKKQVKTTLKESLSSSAAPLLSTLSPPPWFCSSSTLTHRAPRPLDLRRSRDTSASSVFPSCYTTWTVSPPGLPRCARLPNRSMLRSSLAADPQLLTQAWVKWRWQAVAAARLSLSCSSPAFECSWRGVAR